MDDHEFERQMEEYSRRRRGSGSDLGPDDGSDILTVLFVAVLVVGAIAAGLGWVDNQFGWGLREWFTGLLTSAGR